MKKLLLLSAATIMLAAALQAQPGLASVKTEKKEERKELRKLNGNVVSERAKEQFFSDFGNMSGAQWKRSTNFDEVVFNKDGKVTTAFYDDAANLVGTTSASNFASLPAKAQDFINDNYKGYSKGDVIFFDDNEYNDTDMLLFNQQFDDEDSYFVELKKGNKAIIVEVNMGGDVSYFTGVR
jgi:hypothetical protein